MQDILSIGDKIDIKHLDHTGRPMSNYKSYVSQLLDFIDYNTIHIATPISNNRIVLLTVGEKFNLCFYTNKGLYQCNCVVINNFRDNKLIIAEAQVISDLEKFQRRQHYRLECVLETQYRIITTEEELLERKIKRDEFDNDRERSLCKIELKGLEFEWIKASVTDISGGGARINSDLKHSTGDKVEIKLEFALGDENKKMTIGADIISSDKSLNRIGIYVQRIKFNKIEKKEREELIKYIFEQERRQRKNSK